MLIDEFNNVDYFTENPNPLGTEEFRIEKDISLGGGEAIVNKRENPLLTHEIKTKVEQHLADAASFLNKCKARWFLAGGTALDLAGGDITRDHTDIDIAMLQEDLPIFFQYATQNGYRFEESIPIDRISYYEKKFGHSLDIRSHDKERGRVIININTPEELKECYSPFVIPMTSNAPFQDAIDLDVIRRDPSTEDIIYPGHQNVQIPFRFYESPSIYQAVNGESVPLVPTGEAIIHKLFSGRRKDLIDIKQALTSLNNDQRVLLDDMLKKLNIVFQLPDGKTITTLNDLLSLDSEFDLNQEINTQKEIIKADNLSKDINEELFPLLEQSHNMQELLELIKAKFGPLILEKYSSEIIQLAENIDFNQKPNKSDFSKMIDSTFNTEEHMRQKAIDNVLSARLWNVLPLEENQIRQQNQELFKNNDIPDNEQTKIGEIINELKKLSET